MTGLLESYARMKLDLAAPIRALVTLARVAQRPAAEAAGRDLLARLAEDRFNVAVVGLYNRGKSSIVNALLRGAWLPTGVVPVTSVITTVGYGERGQLLLHLPGAALPVEERLDRIGDVVSEEGNPGNRRRVQRAEVRLPTELLRLGFSLVDTPGVGSTVIANSTTTRQFMPQIDAAIFVTSVEAPLGEADVELLHELHAFVDEIVVVVNKIDLVSPAALDEALRFVRTRLATEGFGDDVLLLPVSTTNRAGLESLEDAVSELLVGRKQSVLLKAMMRRTHALLSEVEVAFRPGDGARAEAETSAESAGSADLLAKTELANVRGALGHLEGALSAGGRDGAGHDAAPDHGRWRPVGRCPVCARVRATVFDFLCKEQYTLQVSAERRQAYAEHGFCDTHLWQYQRLASPLGVSVGYAPAIERASRELVLVNQAPSAAVGRARLRALQPSPLECSACRVARAAEDTALHETVNEHTLLCLPHLERRLAQDDGTESWRPLVRAQAAILARIAEGMQLFALKSEALRRDLVNASESAAQLRAVAALAAEPGAVASGTEDRV